MMSRRSIIVGFGKCVQNWRGSMPCCRKAGGSPKLGCTRLSFDASMAGVTCVCTLMWAPTTGACQSASTFGCAVLGGQACTSTLCPTPSTSPIGAWEQGLALRPATPPSIFFGSQRQAILSSSPRNCPHHHNHPSAYQTSTTPTAPDTASRRLLEDRGARDTQNTTFTTPTAQLRYFSGLRYRAHHKSQTLTSGLHIEDSHDTAVAALV